MWGIYVHENLFYSEIHIRIAINMESDEMSFLTLITLILLPSVIISYKIT